MRAEEKPLLSDLPQQDESDDEIPDLADDSDMDLEDEVPELIDVFDDDDEDDDDEMPALEPHTIDDISSNLAPPLVADDSFDDLPELVDANGEPVTRKVEPRCRRAVRSIAYGPRATEQEVSQGGDSSVCWNGNGKSTIHNAFLVTGKADQAYLTLPIGTESMQSSPSELLGQQPQNLLYGTALGKLYTDLPGLDGSAAINDSDKVKALPALDDTGSVKGANCRVPFTGVTKWRLATGAECLVERTGAGGVKEAEPQEWSTGLFDCFEDIPTCLLGAFCPCILYGKTRSLLTGLPCAFGAIYHILGMVAGMGMSGCGLFYGGLVPCTGATLRTIIRDEYGLEGATEACPTNGILRDCVVHYCCHPCALCQEHREMKFRKEMENGPEDTYTKPPVMENMERRSTERCAKDAGAEEDAGGIFYTVLAGE